MADTVKLVIDDREYQVPAGINLVDAGKMFNIDIPIFCYHPKLSPVGMCRMCLVELGSVVRDPQTKAVVMDDAGNPQVRWLPKVQTACTQVVTDGMYVRTMTEAVDQARENVLEFLLTSHPLDCPICDKGGECPLQNLTMEHGPGTTRMNFADKIHLDKHVPLGELIFLDRERCIQCARCVRFQDEIVGDDVLAFHERGRSLQIITVSEPGFDTYFSGNTTDICPVGALTTADFRFGARPWELTNVPSICPHCPVGCDTTLSTRQDRDTDGKVVIKRVMPRQNEAVNEIWICDKGRFGHHFTRSTERLKEPMLRNKSGNLTSESWNDALEAVLAALQTANGSVAALAGPMMTNEDLWELRRVLGAVGSQRLGAWPPTHAGQDIVAQVGVGEGTALKELGKGDAILVIASDLEEEAPIWYLQLKQAHDRGAALVVANARHTRLDDFADECPRYAYGSASNWLSQFAGSEAAQKLTGAANLVVVAGAEGLSLDGSRALMEAAAKFLIGSGHVGKPNNGLMATFPGANGMGQYYMGFTPENTQDIINNPPKVLIVAQADPLSDDPNAAEWYDKVETVISLTLTVDDTAQRAGYVLPVQSFAERDGSYVNGQRRVQRFYTAQSVIGQALPAWQVFSRLGERLGLGRAKMSAAAVALDISQHVPGFQGARYKDLSKVEVQYPIIGRDDVYYGGTAYDNTGGLGVQLPTAADRGEAVSIGSSQAPAAPTAKDGELLIVPTTRLYNRDDVFRPSALMNKRIPEPFVEINAADAARLGIADGDMVQVNASASTPNVYARAHVNGAAPQGTVLLPRHLTDKPVPLALTAGVVSKVEG